MPGEADSGARSAPALRTLADKVNWLIDRAHPARRGPYSNNEVAALIEKTTGEPVSYTTIWKLRNGQATNPQKKLIEAMARTFGVPAAFLRRLRQTQAGLLQEQVELLALIRDARINAFELRALLKLSPEARQVLADLVAVTARVEARRQDGQSEARRTIRLPGYVFTGGGAAVSPAGKRGVPSRLPAPGGESTERVEVSSAWRRRERAACRYRPGA